jgi:outer membrane receptor protein involved in Fe transport
VTTIEGNADVPLVDAEPTPVTNPAADADKPVTTGSHIRRLRLMPDDKLIFTGPLTTEIEGRDYLQMRRQFGGVALPDTTSALGHSKRGGPNTDLLELRLLPTLILLNGRRLISSPYSRTGGADYVDLNQLPLQLIERIEISKGTSAALYGDGAIGGAINFITRRNYEGVEVEIGGQASDKFDQGEQDISLTLGTGSERTGMNATVSYFNRQPLAATDRDWIGQRGDRIESLLGSPASYQQLTNYTYPFPDPACDIATRAGHASGLEARLRGYGPPGTLGLLPSAQDSIRMLPDVQGELLMAHDVARGNSDGVIDPLETATYCTTNFSPHYDLIVKDQRIQTYSTFWHKFGEHVEGFGELGYYRTDNQNRTAASFPLNRLTADANTIDTVWVPPEHADQPVADRGFSAVATDQVPNHQFIVGRVAGLSAGANVNKRSVDVFRAVLGLKGDLKAAGTGSVLQTWDWEMAGVFSASSAISTVPDVLLDKLADALRSCAATRVNADRETVPTTIKERQEAGCYNPFYSSIVNNVALDPLGVSKASTSSRNGFITSDSDMPGQKGYGVQDGGYICDPNDPNSPPCPQQFDRNGDGVYELAGTPNTKQVMDRIMGEQITIQRRTLSTLDGIMRGDLAQFSGGGLSFALGTQYRRESVSVNYDAASNQRLYGFLFGGPDVPSVSRNTIAGFTELRLQLLKGLVELQPAVRIEHYDTVGAAVNPLLGLSVRPFAAAATPPAALEWLLVRGHIGRGHRAPSLMQMYGTQTLYQAVEFFGATNFVPHQVSGNPHLDFEKYTTLSGGVQWDFVGIHVGADFWTTKITDVIASDNSQTLLRDCEAQYDSGAGDCREQVLLSGSRTLDHIESAFENIGSVSTNGIDGGASYTLDSKRRGLGDFGALMLGVQGTFINSYLISSPRALREYYRDGADIPEFKNGARDYSKISAEYEAAGYRNLDNFAPPMPRLRFSVPLRWLFNGHVLGVTMRYIGGYNDDSETTIERYGLADIHSSLCAGARSWGDCLAVSEGESIPSWTVFDANYGYTFDGDGYKIRLTVGVINLANAAPPAVESPLGYEIGVHDPRGRMVYARLNGAF